LAGKLKKRKMTWKVGGKTSGGEDKDEKVRR